MYLIENITSLPMLEALLEKSKISRIRYQNRLGSSTVKSYNANQNLSERASDRAEWEINLATAQNKLASSTPDTEAYRKASVEVKEFDYKLSKIDLEDTDEVGPDDVADSLFNKDINEVIFEKYNVYIAALEARKVALS